MGNSAIQFYRDMILNHIEEVKDSISPTKYKLYVAIVNSCEDLEALRDMADFDMQSDFLAYTNDISSKLGKYNTTMDELESVYNGGYEINNLDDIKREEYERKRAEKVEETANTVENMVNRYGDYEDMVERLRQLEVVQDDEEYGIELKIEMDSDDDTDEEILEDDETEKGLQFSEDDTEESGDEELTEDELTDEELSDDELEDDDGVDGLDEEITADELTEDELIDKEAGDGITFEEDSNDDSEEYEIVGEDSEEQYEDDDYYEDEYFDEDELPDELPDENVKTLDDLYDEIGDEENYIEEFEEEEEYPDGDGLDFEDDEDGFENEADFEENNEGISFEEDDMLDGDDDSSDQISYDSDDEEFYDEMDNKEIGVGISETLEFSDDTDDDFDEDFNDNQGENEDRIEFDEIDDTEEIWSSQGDSLGQQKEVSRESTTKNRVSSKEITRPFNDDNERGKKANKAYSRINKMLGMAEKKGKEIQRRTNDYFNKPLERKGDGDDYVDF